MSKNYTHLGLVQRYQIEALLRAGHTQKQVAEALKVHPSTICRELKRNTPLRGRHATQYLAANAERRTRLRHDHKPKHRIFCEAEKQRVMALLRAQKWSPELISRFLRLSGAVMVSHERIYQWIWQCKHSHTAADRPFREAWRLLRHCRRRQKRGNRRERRGVIHGRVGIEQRPEVVKQRKRTGDVEVDLMMGKNSRGAVLVMTDRATLHTRLAKLADKSSRHIASVIVKKCLGGYRVRTLTFDNDQAFSAHRLVAKALKAETYFTRPYTSQDKGTVENRIGVIRRFIPKKTDLRMITHQQIKKIERLINDRPVRKFNYLTPNQMLLRKIALTT